MKYVYLGIGVMLSGVPHFIYIRSWAELMAGVLTCFCCFSAGLLFCMELFDAESGMMQIERNK